MGTSARDTNQQDVSSQKHPPPLLSPRRLLPRKQHQLKLKLPLPRLLPPKLPLPRLLPSKLPQQRLPLLRLPLLRLLLPKLPQLRLPLPRLLPLRLLKRNLLLLQLLRKLLLKRRLPQLLRLLQLPKAAALKTAVKEKKEAVKAETLKGKGMKKKKKLNLKFTIDCTHP